MRPVEQRKVETLDESKSKEGKRWKTGVCVGAIE